MIKGVLHPNQKLACFVLKPKILNTFMKNIEKYFDYFDP